MTILTTHPRHLWSSYNANVETLLHIMTRVGWSPKGQFIPQGSNTSTCRGQDWEGRTKPKCSTNRPSWSKGETRPRGSLKSIPSTKFLWSKLHLVPTVWCSPVVPLRPQSSVRLWETGSDPGDDLHKRHPPTGHTETLQTTAAEIQSDRPDQRVCVCVFFNDYAITFQVFQVSLTQNSSKHGTYWKHLGYV